MIFSSWRSWQVLVSATGALDLIDGEEYLAEMKTHFGLITSLDM